MVMKSRKQRGLLARKLKMWLHSWSVMAPASVLTELSSPPCPASVTRNRRVQSACRST